MLIVSLQRSPHSLTSCCSQSKNLLRTKPQTAGTIDGDVQVASVIEATHPIPRKKINNLLNCLADRKESNHLSQDTEEDINACYNE